MSKANPSTVVALNDEIESLRQQLADSQKQVTLLRGLLLRYRTETPPAHSPHMICHLVDEALAATEPK